MSIVDWIPVASTIKNAMSDPKGRQVADYTCNMQTAACGTGTEAAAIRQCEADIDQQAIAYIRAFIPNWGDHIIGGALSAGLTVIVGAITRQLILQSASRTAVAVSGGVTAVLFFDGVLNVYIVIRKLNQILAAAQLAKSVCCVCRPPACGDGGPVAKDLEISRWYLGYRRSLDNTTRDMQAEAAKNYASYCNGTCPAGSTCSPVAYVTASDVGVSGYTWLKYDIYCECK